MVVLLQVCVEANMAFAPGSMLIRGFLSGAVTASICYSTYQQLHAKTIHIEHQEKGLLLIWSFVSYQIDKNRSLTGG